METQGLNSAPALILDTGVAARYLMGARRYPAIHEAVIMAAEDFRLYFTLPIRMELENWFVPQRKKMGLERSQMARTFLDTAPILFMDSAAQLQAIELSKAYNVGGVADLQTGAVAIMEDVQVFTLNAADFIRLRDVRVYYPANWDACKRELN